MGRNTFISIEEAPTLDARRRQSLPAYICTGLPVVREEIDLDECSDFSDVSDTTSESSAFESIEDEGECCSEAAGHFDVLPPALAGLGLIVRNTFIDFGPTATE